MQVVWWFHEEMNEGYSGEKDMLKGCINSGMHFGKVKELWQFNDCQLAIVLSMVGLKTK